MLEVALGVFIGLWAYNLTHAIYRVAVKRLGGKVD